MDPLPTARLPVAEAPRRAPHPKGLRLCAGVADRRREGARRVDRHRLEQTLRNWGARIAIFIAVVACLQVGYVRYQHAESTSSLTRKLGDLERRNRRTIDQLSSQLDRARIRTRQLREELADSDHANASLRYELRAAAESARSLQTQVRALSESLRDEPPFLEVRLEPSNPMEGLVAVATNRGTYPVQIAESRGVIWIGDIPDEVGDVLNEVTVEPGFESEFYEIPLIGNEPELVNEESIGLRGALCLVYERWLDDGSRPWTSEFWFEYRPGTSSVEFIDQSSWPLAAGEIPCELEIAQQPW